MPGDQKLGELALSLGEAAPVLIQNVEARASGAETLALGDDPSGLRRPRLDRLCPITAEFDAAVPLPR